MPKDTVSTSLSRRREFEVPRTVSPTGGSKLRIAPVNPLEYEAELKALMAAGGLTAFGEYFDRGYRDVVADGGVSWFGFDEAGRLQMCLTQFVHRFQFGGTRLVAGMTGNVMAAEAYRTFFPAVSLFKRMLSDTRDRGEQDFVYGDPTPQACAISQVVKMDHVGNLDRLVLPIADARLTRHVGARILSRAPSMLGGKTAPDVRCYPAATREPSVFELPLGPNDRMLAYHPMSMLTRRLRGFPGPRDYIVELRWGRGATDWDALVLLRLADHARVLSILSLRRRSDISLRAVVPALAPIARRLGAYRLQIETLLQSKMAREFCSLGFRPRGDILPIYVKAFSPAGEAAVRNVSHWEVTALDMERLS